MKKETESKTVIINGIVNFIGYGKTKYDSTDKYRISLHNCNINHSDFDEVYDTVSKSFQPKWYSEKLQDITFKSLYDIPALYFNTENQYKQGKLSELIDIVTSHEVDYGFKDMDIDVKVICKEGAIYPVAIKVNKVGISFNPFDDWN